MEGGTGDKETPQPPTGAWPAEVWLAGEEPKEEDEHVKEALDPKLEKAQGKFGQIFNKMSKTLVRKK
ncbi:MAG: hypothetical protein QOE80_2920 [Actinomycetota bacterium]|jgi:hypothetical protein|nr:hypothetical protein [Actinomycetota bacterium]